MEADLVTRLATAGIAGIGADQVSWGERRKGRPVPALVLHKIAPGILYSHDGSSALEEPRIQVSVIAASPAEIDRLGRAVRAAIEAPAIVGDTKFGGAFLNMEIDLPPQTIDGGAHVFERALDFELTFEPAP